MKKLILIMGILLLACPAFAGKMTPVLSSTQVVYSPVANVWSTGSMVEDRIVLSKKTLTCALTNVQKSVTITSIGEYNRAWSS